MMQKHQIEIEIVETDRALEELKKIGSQDPVYKSAGPIPTKSQKELLKQLGEKKELSNTRVMVPFRGNQHSYQHVEGGKCQSYNILLFYIQ